MTIYAQAPRSKTTLAARKIMHAHGVLNHDMWTNDYKGSIAVKCYKSGTDGIDLVDALHKQFPNQVTLRNAPSRSALSIIVSFPYRGYSK